MTNQSECIFCKIAAGDIPSTKVYESDFALAFMDISPVAKGHVLLIPKKHFTTIDQIPADDASAFLCELPKLAKAVQQATCCSGINILQNNGASAGQVVGHVHFHIIPRYSDDEFNFNWPAKNADSEQVAKLAEQISSLV